MELGGVELDHLLDTPLRRSRPLTHGQLPRAHMRILYLTDLGFLREKAHGSQGRTQELDAAT